MKYLIALMLTITPAMADENLRIIAVGGHLVGDIPYVDIGVRKGDLGQDQTITLTVPEARNVIQGIQDEIPPQ